ncbi:hypothetical protein [uncultured Shewanella sp.]|uniref:hypothetical protein n=1 Tax=uncultured Shewanella sp. TaxID=173975 RepID=UPI00261689D1|nr:hypothetical protein [uncultured Shewanella sp.]
MKKSVLALSVISALFLAGCSSDDDNEVVTPDPVETKSISVSVNSNITKETVSADIVYPVNPSPEEVPLAQVYSKSGYPHFLRTDSYKLCIEPESAVVWGEPCFTVSDLANNEETFEFEINAKVEDVKAVLEFEGKHHHETANYYYTAVGSTKVEHDMDNFEVTAKFDPSYSYVTIEGLDAIDGLNTFINTQHFALTQTEHEDDEVGKGLYYGYIRKTSDLDLTTIYDEKYEDEISYNSEEPKHTHYKVGKTIEDGSIIITPPNLGEPIVVEPTEPVISKEQLIGANIVGEPNMWTGETTIIGTVKSRISILPTTKFTKNTVQVKQIDFSVKATAPIDELSSDVPYVNIYLENGQKYDYFVGGINNGKVINQSLQGTCSAEHIGSGLCFESFADFQLTDSEHGQGDQFLDNWSETARMNTNFILRIGDSNDDLANVEAVITDFSVTINN